MIRFLFPLFPFVLSSAYACSQDFLVLSGLGVSRQFKFYEGDKIKFQLEGEKYFNRGEILAFRNDSILFSDIKINIKGISKVDIRAINVHRVKPELYSQFAVTLGLGYLFVDQFNHTVVKHRGWDIDQDVVRTSALFIAVGILIHKTKRRYFRVNKRNRIQIVTF